LLLLALENLANDVFDADPASTPGQSPNFRGERSNRPP